MVRQSDFDNCTNIQYLDNNKFHLVYLVTMLLICIGYRVGHHQSMFYS